MYIYRFLNIDNETIYIGITKDFFRRVEQQHFTNIGHLPLECYMETCKVEYMEYKDLSKIELEIIEGILVQKYKPKYNNTYEDIGDIRNSRFITINEDYLVEDWIFHKEINIEETIKNTQKKKLKEEGKVSELRITLEEYERIIKYLDEIKDYRAKALITIAYSTNLRVSEILQLTIDNYNSKDLITEYKKGNTRRVILPNIAIQSIEKYIQVRKNTYKKNLFMGLQGAINRQTVDSIIKKIFVILELDISKASMDSIRNKQVFQEGYGYN